MRRRGLVFLLLAAALPVLLGPGRAGAKSDQPDPAVSADVGVPDIAEPRLLAAGDTTGGLAPAAFAGTLVSRAGEAETGRPAADTSLAALESAEENLVEYDPWIRFNEKTFGFNRGLDTHVIKPVAKFYDKIVPNVVQRAFKNVFENVGSIRRILNTALQGRFDDSGQELGRLVINTVFGLGGFVDAAPSFGVRERVEADTGQTFGAWGADPGPYLVLPFLPPFTVRDAFGFVFDTAMDPVSWVAPVEAFAGVTTEKTVNDRSLNLELYQNVEENVFDLYSAVRNAYLQRRTKAVLEGVARRFGRRERLILSGDEAGPPDPPKR